MKKMISLLKQVLLVAAIAGLLSACASSPDPSEAYKGESQEQIYQAGKTALQDKNFSEAIKRFEALDVQYPFGEHTESAQFYLIYAYYMKDDHALAVAAADRFIRLHPTNPHVDYAYYMRGLANYYQNLGVIERLFSVDLATRDLTQMQKAYRDFSDVVYHYPNSIYAPSAHQYMIYLRNMMAAHELHVANYYYQKHAYVAASNRASNIVAHYEGAPAVEDALVVMVQSYHHLGLTKMEQDALAVLKYNYPNKTVDLS